MGVGITWIPAFAGKTMVMRGWGYVDSGFRRKDDGDRGWGYVDSGFRRKDDGDGGWGYVDSGFRRKDGRVAIRS